MSWWLCGEAGGHVGGLGASSTFITRSQGTEGLGVVGVAWRGVSQRSGAGITRQGRGARCYLVTRSLVALRNQAVLRDCGADSYTSRVGHKSPAAPRHATPRLAIRCHTRVVPRYAPDTTCGVGGFVSSRGNETVSFSRVGAAQCKIVKR